MPSATTRRSTFESRTLTLRSRTIDKRMSLGTNRLAATELGHYAFAFGRARWATPRSLILPLTSFRPKPPNQRDHAGHSGHHGVELGKTDHRRAVVCLTTPPAASR